MKNDISYFDLIDLIEKQAGVIKSQASTIINLLNDNAEKENAIESMMEEMELVEV